MALSIKTRYIVACISLAGLLNISVVNAADNLLKNPSFEHPYNTFLNAIVPDGATWIEGWTVTGAGVHWMTESLGYFTDPIGKDAVDLANYTYASGGIQQSFATVAGGKYNVGFYGATFGNETWGEITVSINGIDVNTYKLFNTTSASNTWKYFSFDFIATGATTTLGFSNSQAASMQYSFLDNASVFAVPVPEPAHGAMMLVGLGLLGFVVRRQQS